MPRTITIILDEFNNNKQKMKALQEDIKTLLNTAIDVNNFLELLEILEKKNIYEERMSELASEQRLLIEEYNSL